MRRARLPIWQRPLKPSMVAEACGHRFLAEVAYRCRSRQRRAIQRESDVQFKIKGIELQTCGVGFQPENSARGARINDLENAAARETVPGEVVELRSEAISAAGKRSNNGEEKRCAPGPHRRIAGPK